MRESSLSVCRVSPASSTCAVPATSFCALTGCGKISKGSGDCWIHESWWHCIPGSCLGLELCPVLAQGHWQHLLAGSCALGRGSAWSLLSPLGVVRRIEKIIVFIIPVIPAAFHYRGVSVHVDNQTIWESSASVSVSHRHPWFVPGCSAIIPVCCCCQRLGTAAAPPPLPSELSPNNTC